MESGGWLLGLSVQVHDGAFGLGGTCCRRSTFGWRKLRDLVLSCKINQWGCGIGSWIENSGGWQRG